MNSERKTKYWYQLKQGDLLRNKNDGQMVVIMATWTKFFQDPHAMHYDVDYGVAGTAIRVQWIENGHEHTFRMNKMKKNWELV